MDSQCKEILADFVLVLRGLYPQATLQIFNSQKVERVVMRMKAHFDEFNCIRLAPLYFEYVMSEVRYGDPFLILKKCATKKLLQRFLQEVRSR